VRRRLGIVTLGMSYSLLKPRSRFLPVAVVVSAALAVGFVALR